MAGLADGEDPPWLGGGPSAWGMRVGSGRWEKRSSVMRVRDALFPPGGQRAEEAQGQRGTPTRRQPIPTRVRGGYYWLIRPVAFPWVRP